MARSFSNAKLLSAFVFDTISVPVVSRRGYAAGSQGAASAASVRGGGGGVMASKKGGEETTKKVSSWVPDPVTGFYRPESHANEICVAELREMLLKNKNNVVRRN